MQVVKNTVQESACAHQSGSEGGFPLVLHPPKEKETTPVLGLPVVVCIEITREEFEDAAATVLQQVTTEMWLFVYPH